MDGVPKANLTREEILGKDIISVLNTCKIFSSKGEAKKMVQNGGVFINKEKVTDADRTFMDADFLNNKYILVQKGKKNYYLIISEN